MKKSGTGFLETTKIALPVGAIWLGYICGPGIASGQMIASYCNVYGAYGLIVVFGVALVGALGCYILGELARIYKAYTYADLFKVYAGPIGRIKVFLILNDIYTILGSIISFSAMIAMFAVFAQLFGISVTLTKLVGIVAFLLLSIWGIDFVRKANSALTIVIVVGFLIATIICVSNPGGSISIKEIFATGWYPTDGVSPLGEGLSGAIYRTILYATPINCIHGAPAMAHFTEKKHAAWAAIWGFIFVGSMYLLGFFAIMAWSPEVLTQSGPLMWIFRMMNSTAGEILYYIVLACALVSTAIPLIVSLAVRFDFLFKKTTLDPKVRTLIVGIILCVISWFVSNMGLTAIVTKPMTYLSYYSLIFSTIPIVFIWPFILKKKRREVETRHLEAQKNS